MSPAEFRCEVKRARRILKRLGEATDKSRAALAVREIVYDASHKYLELLKAIPYSPV